MMEKLSEWEAHLTSIGLGCKTIHGLWIHLVLRLLLAFNEVGSFSVVAVAPCNYEVISSGRQVMYVE